MWTNSAYAVGISVSFRRYKKDKNIRLNLTPMTIIEFFGKCKKINVINAFISLNIMDL